MFSFLHEADVRRAWDRRPWIVKGEHLILKRFCSDISVSEVDFSTTEFWIQIHGLPLNRRSKENVLKIGSIAGKALDTDLIGPDNGEFQPGIKLDDFLIPNRQAMVSMLPASRPSVQINQSSRIPSAKDSRVEMITGEAHGKREELVEVLEQSKMVTLLQNDGTSLENVTDVQLNSLASPNLCSNLVTS
nr:hypothetical protein CFP56_45517 [Quercus suber]